MKISKCRSCKNLKIKKIFRNQRKINISSASNRNNFNMAERKGFEPLIPLTVYTLSKRAPSTTRPSLLVKFIIQ